MEETQHRTGCRVPRKARHFPGLLEGASVDIRIGSETELDRARRSLKRRNLLSIVLVVVVLLADGWYKSHFYQWYTSQFYLAVTTAAGAALFVLWTRHSVNKEMEEQTRVAGSMGFTETLVDFEALDVDDWCVFSGEDTALGLEGRTKDTDVWIADCCHETTNFGGRSVSYHTIFCFRKRPTIPIFELRPKPFKDWLPTLTGQPGIDLESAPAFSKRWILTAPDESAIRLFFGPDLLKFMAKQSDWHVRSSGPWLVVFKWNHTVRPRNLPPYLDEAVRVFAAFQHT